MWIPDYFKIEDEKIIHQFVREVGLATVISKDESFPVATHIPLELETNSEGNLVLSGHLAKANPHAHLLKNQPEVLVIFQSPINHYISSSWYKEPNAPTWNYMSVHISGKASEIKGDALWQSVKRLTDRYEANSKNPVSLENLPKNIQAMLNGVSAFEISIENVQAAFKMSQNRIKEDYKNIIKELNQLNDPIAKLMAEVLLKKEQY